MFRRPLNCTRVNLADEAIMFKLLLDLLSSPLEVFSEMWPYYLATLMLAEILLYLKITRGQKVFVRAAICALLLIEVAVFFSYGEEVRAWATAVGLILYGIPIALIMGAAAAISKIKKSWMRHAAIITTIFLMMPFYPIWALYVVCLSGLSCI